LIPEIPRSEIRVDYGIKDFTKIDLVNQQIAGSTVCPPPPATICTTSYTQVSQQQVVKSSHGAFRITAKTDLLEIVKNVNLGLNASYDSDGGYFAGGGVGVKF
jgi:hypothetical protein